MEDLVSGEGRSRGRDSRLPAPSAWRGRRVLLTGHTGFKGAWLLAWLAELGAEVHGLALDPPTTPSLFDDAGLETLLSSDARVDVRDAAAVAAAVDAARPEVVLHLAAQSLVRRSHAEPLATLETNVQGTANVLDAACRAGGVGAVVVVTSDKCYENRETPSPYREDDALGGFDPYSASKACAEIVTTAWRASFAATESAPRLASARAGNVIGAWDWAEDRLVPDCVRAFRAGEPVRLRNPGSVRPWQHVLEPLSGYLVLAERLLEDAEPPSRGWNFGPDSAGDARVVEVARAVADLWGDGARVVADDDDGHPLEAGVLRLDSTRARVELGWCPRWSVEQALEKSVEGYRVDEPRAGLRPLLSRQVADYAASAPRRAFAARPGERPA